MSTEVPSSVGAHANSSLANSTFPLDHQFHMCYQFLNNSLALRLLFTAALIVVVAVVMVILRCRLRGKASTRPSKEAALFTQGEPLQTELKKSYIRSTV